MAEAGLQAPDIPAPPPPPVQPNPTQQGQQPAQPTQQVQQTVQPVQQEEQVVHLNWSHFISEFSGKPEEDAEAYLLRTNDCMNTHHFRENVKVQKFCPTLIGEARLWYESLEPINVDWQGLQNLFRKQCSKISNTREQLFHAL